jgi:DNA-binding CsgD family transcriptional regulator
MSTDHRDQAVADPLTTHADHVTRGRTAAERRAWPEAFAAFAAADAAVPLEADDLQVWAIAAYLLGHVDTGVDALARAFHTHRENGDLSAAVRCGFWIFFILSARGDMAQAGGWRTRCDRLLASLPADAAEHGYMLCSTAFLLAVERDYATAQETADRAVEIGRQTRDEDLVALGLNVAGRAAILDGRAADGFLRLDEAMVAVVSGELSPPTAGAVYCSLIEACEEIAEVRRAREWTDALTRWCERQEGMVTFTGQCLTHRATILRRSGAWQAAAEQAARACERFAGAADEVATGMALYELAEVHRVQGNLDAAEDAFRRAGAWGHDPQPGLALVRLAQGRTDVAAAALRRLLTERTDVIDRLKLLPTHVEAMLAVGDQAAAAAAAAELTDHAGTYGTDALRAEADRSHGAVLLAEGDAAAAAVRLRSACTTWQALEAPYETARTRVLISLACRQLGDHDTATLERGAAHRAFTDLGAAADLARLAADDAQPVHGLTPRELEVLRLVATGRTNQAIADELYVAVKTVDRHVASILAKLRVPSRTAATAFAYEHDLL